MTLPRRLLLPALATPFLALGPAARALPPPAVIVGGIGGALGALRTVAIWFTEATGIEVTVLPSLGSEGGLRATADGKLHVGVIGRPPREPDLARGVSEVQVWRVPLGFVTSVDRPKAVGMDELAAFLGDPASTWPDGTPVRPILRHASESDYPILFKRSPSLETAIQRLRRRPELPVAATDQEALDLAERLEGSLVNATLSQVITEGRDLRFVPIDGVTPTVDALESGANTLVKPMHVIRSLRTPPQGEQFLAYLRSSEGQSRLRRCGCLV